MNKVFIVLFAILYTTTFSIASPNVILQQLPENNVVNISSNQKAYIVKYKDVAMEAMKVYDVLASVSLAQGILESGAGTSDLVTSHKNHFAISCNSTLKATDDCYKAYENDEDSFMEHAKLIKEDKTYKRLFSHAKTNYIKWAYGLRKYGYATGKNYPKRLLFYIEKYKLYQYDDMVLAKRLRRGAKKEKFRKLTPAEKAKKKADDAQKQLDSINNVNEIIVEPKAVDTEITETTLDKTASENTEKLANEEGVGVPEDAILNEENNEDVVAPADAVLSEETTDEAVVPADVVVEEENNTENVAPNEEVETEEKILDSEDVPYEMTNTSDADEQMPEAVEADDTPIQNENVFDEQYYIVKKGDTYYNISNRYGLTVPYLKQLNNATSNLILIGQRLRVSGEATEYRLHDIVKGDTLYNISNRYGVTINYLKLLNGVGEDNLIYIGRVLKY